MNENIVHRFYCIVCEHLKNSLMQLYCRMNVSILLKKKKKTFSVCRKCVCACRKPLRLRNLNAVFVIT